MNIQPFRRFVATVLCAGLALSAAEAAIADVHDGDASAEEVANVASALGCDAIPLSDHGGSSEQPGHEAHVCHAGHAHLVLLTTRADGPAITRPVQLATIDEPDSLVDFTTSPDVPPPIS